jgi:hypothetical protein
MSTIAKQRVQGAIILERLAGTTVPAALKPPIAAFRKSHGEYEAAAVVADTAREKRDQALDDVGEADHVFDAGVHYLGNKLVGAGLGTRKNPFAGLSNYTPSELTDLPYAEEPKAIRALGEALVRKDPPVEVTKALAASLKAAKAIEAALRALVKPQAAYSRALGARDALLPAWTKALGKLKKHAAAAWDDDPATYKATFAPPGAVHAPTKKKATKAKAPAAVKTTG